MTEAHYYPFGLVLNGKWMTGGAEETKYRYNGKEIDEEFGLGWYSYGARYYDPTLARFTGVDPISDQFPWVSTFNYAENEPVGSIDLHGLQRFPVTTEGAFNTVAEGFRRMFQGAARFFDSIKASVYGKKTKILSKTEGKIGNNTISTQKKVEASVTITGGTNLGQFFELTGNKEVIITEPLIGIKSDEKVKAIQETEVKTKIKGVSASIKNSVEINLQNKEMSVSNQVSIGVGQKTGKNSDTGVSIYAKTSKSKNKTTNEVGATAKIKIGNSKLKGTSTEFGFKIFRKNEQ